MERRVALVGASSTGKTTIFEMLKEIGRNFTFISEIARTARKYGFPINEEGTNSTQLVISNLHLEALLNPGNLMLDRCYLDLVVYTGLMDKVSDNVKEYIYDTWDRIKGKYTHFIYFPIEFDIVEDGVRSVDSDWRKLVDSKFKEQLDKLGVPYLTVSGTATERYEQVVNYLIENQ